jgi:hypothetical protein
MRPIFGREEHYVERFRRTVRKDHAVFKKSFDQWSQGDPAALEFGDKPDSITGVRLAENAAIRAWASRVALSR